MSDYQQLLLWDCSTMQIIISIIDYLINVWVPTVIIVELQYYANDNIDYWFLDQHLITNNYYCGVTVLYKMTIPIIDFLINAWVQTVYYCGVAVYTNINIPRKFTKLGESTGRTVHPGIMSWVFCIYESVLFVWM